MVGRGFCPHAEIKPLYADYKSKKTWKTFFCLVQMSKIGGILLSYCAKYFCGAIGL